MSTRYATVDVAFTEAEDTARVDELLDRLREQLPGLAPADSSRGATLTGTADGSGITVKLEVEGDDDAAADRAARQRVGAALRRVGLDDANYSLDVVL